MLWVLHSFDPTFAGPEISIGKEHTKETFANESQLTMSSLTLITRVLRLQAASVISFKFGMRGNVYVEQKLVG